MALVCSFKNRLFQGELLLNDGECGVLMGPSGAGKSTLLLLVAQLLKLDGSSVSLDLKGSRGGATAMVFQDFGLFEHMDVMQNLSYVGATKDEATMLLEQVGLWEKRDIKASRLSGGQKQRLAIVRALSQKPTLLLLDEPFSHLDLTMQVELTRWLRAYCKSRGIIALMVTHDSFQAKSFGDRFWRIQDALLEPMAKGEIEDQERAWRV